MKLQFQRSQWVTDQSTEIGLFQGKCPKRGKGSKFEPALVLLDFRQKNLFPPNYVQYM